MHGRDDPSDVRDERTSAGAARRLSMTLFAMLALVVCGCASESDWTEALFFSPDGRSLAWIHHFVARRNVYEVVWDRYDVRWRAIDDPQGTKSVKVDEAGIGLFPDMVEYVPRVLFSPDSRRLAVAGERGLMIVDVATGRSRQLCKRGEFVISFAWNGSDGLLYVTRTGSEWDFPLHGPSVRTVWRQDLREGASDRKAVHRREEIEPGRILCGRDAKDISPDGKYVVLADLDSEPPLGLPIDKTATISFSLVNLDDGQARPIVAGNCKLSWWGAAWKPDASAVAVIFQDGLYTYRAVLFEPATGRTCDFSEAFTQAYEPPAEVADRGRNLPSLSGMTWTADGEYLVLNGYGGRLVHPEPFRVLEIGKSFGGVFSPDGTLSTEVLPTCVAGWVFGRGADASGDDGTYAIDYRRLRYLQLTGGTRGGTFRELEGLFTLVEGKTITTMSMGPPPYRLAISPDGRRLATIDMFTDQIEIREINLSAP
jgi:hypothetical protein